MIFGIKAQITRYVDDSGLPSFVECQFVDAHGSLQKFIDKDAIFTTEFLNKNSSYPIDAIVGCEILERKNNITKVTTEKPWGIESNEGETIFEVLAEQILEFELQ